jgi:hypothetical protein
MRGHKDCTPLRELFSSHGFVRNFDSGQILFEEVEGNGQQDHIFHEEGNVADHRRESASRLRPAIRMKGMIVTVVMKVTTDPRAPKTPSFLFQKPANNNAPKSHSETPGSMPSL